LAEDYLRKSESFGGGFCKTRSEMGQIFQSNAQVFSQMRKNFNQKCRFSHQTRRGVKMGIRKYSKIFENVQKYSKTFKF